MVAARLASSSEGTSSKCVAIHQMLLVGSFTPPLRSGLAHHDSRVTDLDLGVGDTAIWHLHLFGFDGVEGAADELEQLRDVVGEDVRRAGVETVGDGLDWHGATAVFFWGGVRVANEDSNGCYVG